MSSEYISIQEAAELTDKSIQTIRRAIKTKKIEFKRRKTPQGFNYQVSLASLEELYKVKINASEPAPVKKKIEEVSKEVAKDEDIVKPKFITSDDFNKFASTMETLIRQHSDERQSFLRLVNTLQEKIFVLENQINLLSAPKKKWYQMWK